MMEKDYKDYWVAVEDADTCEVSEFGRADEMDVLYLMDGYRVDKRNPTTVRERAVEGGKQVIYDGVIYRGGFGYNLWVAHRYREL